MCAHEGGERGSKLVRLEFVSVDEGRRRDAKVVRDCEALLVEEDAHERVVVHGVEAHEPQLAAPGRLDVDLLRRDGRQDDLAARGDRPARVGHAPEAVAQVSEAVDARRVVVLCVAVARANVVIDFERGRRR